jgi:hypothetical protein
MQTKDYGLYYAVYLSSEAHLVWTQYKYRNKSVIMKVG